MTKFNLFVFLFCCTISFSQNKNEKEARIHASEFPEKALRHFNTISDQVKYFKLYKETDNDKESFEVKFKLNKLHYSAEFDTLGNLEDIEIVIKEKHIPEQVLKSIMNYFNTTFDSVRFIKIQKQYINKTNKNDQQFIDYVLKSPIGKNTHFEIIADIKTKKNHQLKEFIFNSNGEFEKSRPISSTSYEHALY